MEQMSKDWYERLDKAKTPQEMLDLLNEIPLSECIPLTEKDAQEFSVTDHRPILRLSTSTMQIEKTRAG